MIKRRLVGMILFCIGIGMLLVITMPAGIVFLAIILTACGFYLLSCGVKK